MTLSVPGISIPFYFLWLFILISPIWNKLLTPVNPKGNKLWIFSHLMWRTDSLEKTLIWGQIEGRRRRGWQRMRWLNGITDSVDMNLSKFCVIVKDREGWHAAVHGVAKSWTRLSDWTIANDTLLCIYLIYSSLWLSQHIKTREQGEKIKWNFLPVKGKD